MTKSPAVVATFTRLISVIGAGDFPGKGTNSPALAAGALVVWAVGVELGTGVAWPAAVAEAFGLANGVALFSGVAWPIADVWGEDGGADCWEGHAVSSTPKVANESRFLIDE